MQTMIEWWQAVLLATVQGLSEFLPISSSGHLVLLPRLFGWTDQGLAFDVAVHVGTLLGVLVYFRRDLLPLARGGIAFVSGDREDPHGRLAFNLIVGTIPVGVVGLLFNDVIEEKLRSPLVVAFQLAVFGIVLWLADRLSARSRSESSLSVGQALLIGCAQALALVPGTSRSGITITAGLFSGLTREAAARFSFLLAVPVMTAAGLSELVSFASSDAVVDVRALVLGTLVSAVTGFAVIHFFLRWLTRYGVLPYVLYRLALGTVLLAVLYLSP